MKFRGHLPICSADSCRGLTTPSPRAQHGCASPAVPSSSLTWSPSTGEYDVEGKLKEYQQRGDAEIWRIHPYERTITAWRRQADGRYTEALYRGGTVPVLSLPGVVIDLATLFE